MRTPLTNTAIRSALSDERLQKYMTHAGGDLDRALSFYEWNTRLAEAFYTPIQTIEVCLRNKLNDALTDSYGQSWYDQQSTPLEKDAHQKIVGAKNDLRRAKAPASTGAIIAELSFGFWVALLGPRYDATLWRGALFKKFREHGRPIQRRRVHSRFNAIRRFRNRVAHHEPIFLNSLPSTHGEIIEAVAWMCPDTAMWARAQSRFDDALASRPS